MSECGKCAKPLKNTKVKVSCVDCNTVFHGKCVNMSAEDVEYLSEHGDVWRCEPCALSRRQSMTLETKTNVSYEDVFKLITGLREDFKRVEKNLGASLNACHEELAEFKAVVNQQREDMAAWMKTVEDLRSENAALRKQVAGLECRLDDAEQYARRNTLEIHGIPVQQNEDVVSLVQTVGRALDYTVEPSMIDACHRLRGRDGSGKPPGIIVKMVRRLDAEALLKKRRVKRNLNTHDLGLTTKPAGVVYVNESLTFARRRLLNAARQVKKDKSYTFLWIRGGRILMRKNAGDRVRTVTSVEDLQDL